MARISTNRKSVIVGFILLVAATLFVYWLQRPSDIRDLVEKPAVGDIYVFEAGDIFAPMKVNRIEADQIVFYQYIYSFADAVPKRIQIRDDEWDEEYDAIYDRKEIKRLFKEGKIAIIYRD